MSEKKVELEEESGMVGTSGEAGRAFTVFLEGFSVLPCV